MRRGGTDAKENDQRGTRIPPAESTPRESAAALARGDVVERRRPTTTAARLMTRK
jgi:hypothetical protein